MRLDVRIGDRTRSVEVTRENGHLKVALDGRDHQLDAVEVAEGTYSILIGGRAFEVRVQPGPEALRVHVGGREFAAQVLDPRSWRGRRGGAVEAEGRQQILAPMPGKVVRLLAEPGAAVKAGQGIVVVEAMKMQNEIKAPRSGTLERLLVRPGQAVNAGEILAIVI